MDHQVWEYASAYPVTCPVVVPTVIDADGDGVSSTLDCNDSDPKVSTNQTYYRDADGDGMGSSISISICSPSAPSGYVTHSNETSDANDLMSNAGIEIYGDGKDNDNDGKVDEYNSVTENGYHPYFANLDPNDVSIAAVSLVSWSGLSNGYMKVKYADNSIYKYKVFSTNSLRLTKVKQLNSSAYFKVTAPNGQWAKVNGYTGVTTATGLMAK